MMKKLTSLLLSAALLVGMLACGASAKTNTTVRVAGLKGPTTMGLVNLLAMEQNGTASQNYDLQLYGAADEVVPKLIKGEVDIAAIPANLAATLYQKTSGGIQVMAVNTLGVLYVVEKGDTVHSFADLKGRTILSTGKGTTPEYVLRYLLRKNGIDPDKDVKIEYYSEASEVTAQMAATKKDAIAVLPQPYVTAAQMKDSSLRVVLDLTREWNKVCDTQLITGVTVVRTVYAEEHPEEVINFLKDYGCLSKDYEEHATVWDLLHRLDEINDYIECVDAIYHCLENKEIHSQGLVGLRDYVKELYHSNGFGELRKDISGLKIHTSRVRSITVGINLNDRFEADAVGLLSINSKPFTKAGVLGSFYDHITSKDKINESTEWKENYKFQQIEAGDSNAVAEAMFKVGNLNAMAGNPINAGMLPGIWIEL